MRAFVVDFLAGVGMAALGCGRHARLVLQLLM
jgi:hypothetical protein